MSHTAKTTMTRAAAVALAVALFAGAGRAAFAQTNLLDPTQEGPTSTTDPQATTTTTTSPFPAQLAPATTTTTQPPPPPPPSDGHDEASEETGSEEPPPEGVVVPPPAQPTPPPPNSAIITAAFKRQLKAAVVEAKKADVAVADANAAVAAAQARLDLQQQLLANVERHRGEVVRRLKAARERLVLRAIGAYTGDSLSQVNALLEAEDVNEYTRRRGLIDGVLADSERAVHDYERARRAAGQIVTKLLDSVTNAQTEVSAAQVHAGELALAANGAHVLVDALNAGSAIAIKGFVFPVAAPHRFSNDFGAPRMMGTEFAHWHQGNDIFAAYGSPLVACERGVVTRVGTDRLGGTKFWLVGQSGTRYYYAHLSAYAPDMAEGLVVEAGRLLGYVGDTGNAKGTSPHLHYEIHPSGGPAVNPYWLLKATDDADGDGPTPVSPTTTAPTAPAQ